MGERLIAGGLVVFIVLSLGSGVTLVGTDGIADSDAGVDRRADGDADSDAGVDRRADSDADDDCGERP
jgi:hypothetical protein